MAPITIDESDAPLLRVAFPREGTLEEIRDYYQRLAAILEASSEVVVLVDLRDLNPLKATAEHRAVAAKCFSEIRPLFVQKVTAEALVFPNAMVRGLFTAFVWLLGKSQDWPSRHFHDRDDAERWLRSQLANASAGQS